MTLLRKTRDLGFDQVRWDPRTAEVTMTRPGSYEEFIQKEYKKDSETYLLFEDWWNYFQWDQHAVFDSASLVQIWV